MSDTTKKDSTSELPMVDLEEAIRIVTTIHEKGLETAPMPEVAKGCGYANPTSTPFYRRMLAARLFKLLGSPKPELTELALDYLKPHADGAKQAALTQAMMGIKKYAELVNENLGKKLNPDLLANKLEKDVALSITKVGAKICASVFVNSLRFAGFVSTDGTVIISGATAGPTRNLPATEPPKPKTANEDGFQSDEESQTQTLYLDSRRKRKISIKAPLTVTKDELERIRAWLGFQLIIEEPEKVVEPQ
jgi:hypothetical protein